MPTRGERYEAKINGNRFYFTGRPCINGHISNRQTKKGKCVECSKMYERSEKAKLAKRLRNEANIHKVRERRHKYYLKTKERHRKRGAAWILKNPEKIKAMARRWRQENKVKFAGMVRDWRRKNPALVRMAKYRRRTLEKESGSFSDSDLVNLLTSQNGACVGCGKDIKSSFTIDHKLPLFRGGTSRVENLQLLCLSCNSSKGIKTPEEWIRPVSYSTSL